jgi:hypothetical protein
MPRDHLRYDLQPYQCTYLECAEADEIFYDYHSWNMHEQRMHRRIWVCHLADKCTFSEQALYEEHVRSTHAEETSKLLIPELVTARESTPKLSDRACPICLSSFKHTHELRMHISHHLESIALLALPPGEDIESDSEARSSLESQAAERRRDPLALSTANDFPDEIGQPPIFPENDLVNVPTQGMPLTLDSLQ